MNSVVNKMIELKFHQRNLNNGSYYYWGLIDGIWQNPKIQDNYVHPMDSEQYIGREDKNGAEIYDGDIVMVTHPQDTSGDFTGTCGQVFYDAAECAWYHVGHNGRPPKRMWEYCKVVGNIYKNPRLLESHT